MSASLTALQRTLGIRIIRRNGHGLQLTVSDARLSIAYEYAKDPDVAHRIMRTARVPAPIALGSHGPKVLAYDLVRTVLRDLA